MAEDSILESTCLVLLSYRWAKWARRRHQGSWGVLAGMPTCTRAQRLGAALYGQEQGPPRPATHHAETTLRGEGLGELLSPGQCRLQDEAARTGKRGSLSPRGHPAGGPTPTLRFKEKRGWQPAKGRPQIHKAFGHGWMLKPLSAAFKALLTWACVPTSTPWLEWTGPLSFHLRPCSLSLTIMPSTCAAAPKDDLLGVSSPGSNATRQPWVGRMKQTPKGPSSLQYLLLWSLPPSDHVRVCGDTVLWPSSFLSTPNS